LKLSDLLYEGEYTSESNPETIHVQRIVSDTAELSPHCLFVCIRGAHFDSHRMMTYIAAARASAVVVERGCSFERIPSLPVFSVRDSRATLAHLWSRFCGNPQEKLHLIGITGTNGKTTTAHLLHAALMEAGVRAGLLGTVSCLLGEEPYTLPNKGSSAARMQTMTTPDPDILFPILQHMRSRGITHVVMEVSSHSLQLAKVVPLHFDIALFTNLSPEHLDLHKTMENYVQAKSALFRQCTIGIFNADDAYAKGLITSAACRVIRCGTAPEHEYRAERIHTLGVDGVEYLFHSPEASFQLRLCIPGRFTVYNSLLAATAALQIGVPSAAIRRAFGQLQGVRGRMERLPLPTNEFSVFIDYAHTELALRNLLTTVRSFKKDYERVVLVFGCGGDRDKSKRAPMGACAEELADYTILTSDNSRSEDPRQIIKDILAGFNDKNKRRVITGRKQAIEHAVIHAQPHDIILLVGKGHEMYELTQSGKRLFDERKIVFEALEKRNSPHTNDTEPPERTGAL